MTEVLHVVEVYLSYKRRQPPAWRVTDGRWSASTPAAWGKGVGVLLTDGRGIKRGALHFDSVDDFLRLSAQLHRIAVDLHYTVTKYGAARWVVEHLDLHERRVYPIGELLPLLCGVKGGDRGD